MLGFFGPSEIIYIYTCVCGESVGVGVCVDLRLNISQMYRVNVKHSSSIQGSIKLSLNSFNHSRVLDQ